MKGSIWVVLGLLWGLGSGAMAGEVIQLRQGSVALHREPAFHAARLAWLRSDTRLTLLGRQGCWLRVETRGKAPREGWVYAPALGRLALPREAGPLARFGAEIERLTRYVREVAGGVFFTAARPLDEDTVQLTATRGWLATPRRHRESNLRTLLSLWHEQLPRRPLNIRVVDNRGTLRMSRRLP